MNQLWRCLSGFSIDKGRGEERRHPSFGPKKVLDRLRAEQPEVDWPADSTAGALLKRQGLVKPRRYKPAFPADPQPFASCAAGGLTRLSLWWIRHGIQVHRTEPGKPTQNARHERMHHSLNYARESDEGGASRLTQQQFLTAFRYEYNMQRSHESLERCTPASLYTLSPRPYTPRLQPLEYDVDQLVRSVRHNGEIKFKGGLVYISELLAKHPVGLRQIDEQYYEVRFSILHNLENTYLDSKG